jgi:hypothetical protein
MLVTACGAPAAAPEAALAPSEAVVSPTQAAPPVPAATAELAPGAFRDDFEGALGSGWEWLGEDPAYWDLTSTPGNLRIMAQGSGFETANARNFLVREAPQGDFELNTVVHLSPADQSQFAGFVVHDDQGNSLWFGYTFGECSKEGKSVCGWMEYTDESGTGRVRLGIGADAGRTVMLRLVREGNTYTGHFSTDNLLWFEVGNHETAMKPLRVGLVGILASDGEVPVEFEYFMLEAAP